MFRLFNLTLRLNGFPIREAELELDTIFKLSDAEHQAFLAKKKSEIVTYHLENNAFYKTLVGKTSIENWNDLPVLNKYHLQKPLAERLSKGFTIKNVYLNKTSGSSGTPFVFATTNPLFP